MAKFIIKENFWEIFPDANVGVLVLEELNNNGQSSDKILKFLSESNEEAKKYLTAPQLSQNAVIAVWREAYKKFKTKKGVRSSIEALLKRVDKGNEISSINPLVDIYNGVSLKYGMPCGAEDIDTFAGNLSLAVTEGGDEFYALGDEENSPTLPGEVCYTDDIGAVCRCFNWRDGKRTMITEDTKRAFVVIESVNNERNNEIIEALEEISAYASEELGATKKSLVLLNRNNASMDL